MKFYAEVVVTQVVSGWVEAEDEASASERAHADEWSHVFGEGDRSVRVKSVRAMTEAEVAALVGKQESR